LSLKQPYAELLVSGRKTIEIRKWNTKFRGLFLVHASKNVNNEACTRLNIDPNILTTGAIIGQANLSAVKLYQTEGSFIKDNSKHFAGSNYEGTKYGFLVNQAKRFQIPIPQTGKLGFFDVDLRIGLRIGIQTYNQDNSKPKKKGKA
jgi:predicted transcriptional regulator